MPPTDAKIRNSKPADKPIKLADGAGLYFEVRTSGTKLWRHRHRIAGSENLYALGEYGDQEPKPSLAEARQATRAARALVMESIHPAQAQKTARLATHAKNAITFEIVAQEWIAKSRTGSTPYGRQQIERVFKADVHPAIGKLAIRKVTAARILKIMRSAEARGAPMVAANVRQGCSAVFRYRHRKEQPRPCHRNCTSQRRRICRSGRVAVSGEINPDRQLIPVVPDYVDRTSGSPRCQHFLAQSHDPDLDCGLAHFAVAACDGDDTIGLHPVVW